MWFPKVATPLSVCKFRLNPVDILMWSFFLHAGCVSGESCYNNAIVRRFYVALDSRSHCLSLRCLHEEITI